jgi:uncharacterized damage-inducible protein DinB
MAALANIRMLTRYAAWANTLLYASIAELPPVELTRERQIVFGSLPRTLNHVYSMDLVWQGHLEGRPHGFTTRIPEAGRSVAELAATQTSLDAWYIRYAEALRDSAAEEIVDFTFIGGGQGSMSRIDILLHVVNHTTYHRGHIAGMLYQIPVDLPTTDLPVFLRGAMAR